MLIDDIIGIYKGEYKDYGEYLKEKEVLIKYYKEQTKKQEISLSYEPLFLSKPIFDYIKNKKGGITMEQITQKELIDLIKEKQKRAMNMLNSTIEEKYFGKAETRLKKARCYGEARAYQDLICYLDSVEIVPDKQNVPIIPTTEAIEELGKIDINKIPITPNFEPKVEPLRNDRFREFEKIKKDGYSTKELIDATSIEFIRFYDNKEHFEVEMWCKCGFVNERTFVEEARAKAYYNELVEWWKYWKEQE